MTTYKKAQDYLIWIESYISNNINSIFLKMLKNNCTNMIKEGLNVTLLFYFGTSNLLKVNVKLFDMDLAIHVYP